MASEREETLVEQLKLRDARIRELEDMMAEAMVVMDDLAKAGEAMIVAWNRQQLRLVELENALKGKLS